MRRNNLTEIGLSEQQAEFLAHSELATELFLKGWDAIPKTTSFIMQKQKDGRYRKVFIGVDSLIINVAVLDQYGNAAVVPLDDIIGDLTFLEGGNQ